MSFFKPPKPIRDKKHLQFVAGLPCCVCGSEPVQAHHLLRSGEHGTGRRSGDNWAIPLCPSCHTGLHMDGNEERWLALHHIHGKALAAALWGHTGDFDAALDVVIGMN